ncbi:hypothetical protein BJ684DRAFT_20794 [Piptocephalis cylindrospora]|uniref:Uncharacterized protein n=1 Tax=Piptocephalis cylindrospora TaxID=1907219 RepID=A0A4P9Y3I6_9FUNG|nr:hypothetical protein BJ684DRAFT_20794 [Piptocephalis cylindrospora]|eukprot:RKP12681.1 hypothetical protein BJ684DRAFT_20794 [Piptocephalis cylindrospora]
MFLLVIFLCILLPVLTILFRAHLQRFLLPSRAKGGKNDPMKGRGSPIGLTPHASITLSHTSSYHPPPISLAQSSAVAVSCRSSSSTPKPHPPSRKGIDLDCQKDTALEPFPDLTPSIPFPDLGPSDLGPSDLGSSDLGSCELGSSIFDETDRVSTSSSKALDMGSSPTTLEPIRKDRPSSSLESTDSWIARAYSDDTDESIIYPYHDSSLSVSSHHLDPFPPVDTS